MAADELVFFQSRTIRVTEHAIGLPGTDIPIFAVSSVSSWQKKSSDLQQVIGIVLAGFGILLFIGGAIGFITAPLGHSRWEDGGMFCIMGLVHGIPGIAMYATFKSKTSFYVGISTHSGDQHPVSFADGKSAAEFRSLIAELLAHRTGGPLPQVRKVAEPMRAKSLNYPA